MPRKLKKRIWLFMFCSVVIVNILNKFSSFYNSLLCCVQIQGYMVVSEKKLKLIYYIVQC